MSQNFSLKKAIIEKIKQNGGWVNCHAHIDRSFTLTEENFHVYTDYHVNEKWHYHDKIKKAFTVEDLVTRMSSALDLMIEQGVTGFGSYLDVDPAIEDKSLIASQIVKQKYKDKIDVRFTTQTFKGLLDKEARSWFDKASEIVDIVGSTPRSDLGREAEHIDIVLKTAKKQNKMVHMHIDELHRETEKEMELLADKVMEHGMEGKVVAIHGISLSRQPKDYRQKIYQKIVDADMTIVTCPTAWLDHPRSEELVPFHNSIFPVDEAVAAGVRVALGTDNFEDYTLPFGDGDMWFELRTMAHACRFTDVDELVKIATVNGRKALGME